MSNSTYLAMGNPYLAMGPRGMETVRLSPSIAKVLLDKSPKHAHAAHRLLGNAERAEPSSAVMLGKAVDALAFGGNMVVEKARGNEYSDDVIPLAPAAFITAHRVAAQVLKRLGTAHRDAQVRIEWDSNGVPCSAVLDALSGGVNSPVITELKTAHDVSDTEIVKAIELRRYDLQVAAYEEAVLEKFKAVPSVQFVFAETVAPYDVRVIKPDDGIMARGRDDWKRAVTTWKECIETGNWPGRGDAILGPSRYRTVNGFTDI